MKITSYYTVAIQLLLLCNHYSNEKVTSNFIAKKIGADPVIVRQTMINLKKDNFIDCKPGPGGMTLKKSLKEISLYDLYKCVTDEDENIIKFYPQTKESTSFEQTLELITTNNFSKYIEPFFDNLKKNNLENLYIKIKNTL